MKVSKMSAIFVTLLMLSGALAIVPFVHAQTGTVTLISPNIPIPFQVTSTQSVFPFPPTINVHFLVGTNGTAGTTFWVDVDAYNFTAIALIQVGLTFNSTLLHVLNVAAGSIITTLPSSDWISVSGSTDNVGGKVIAYAWSTTDSYSWNGTGTNKFADLMNVEFEINPSVTNTYLDSIAGTPQNLMGLTYAKGNTRVIIQDVYGNTLSPPMNNATVTYTTPIIPKPPTYSGITKNTSYAGFPCTFSIIWQDKVALSKYIFSFDNGVGYFTNSTATAFTSNPQVVSVTKTLTAKVGTTVRYQWYANDTSSLWNSTATQMFVTTEGTSPTYANVTHSTTMAGASCVFSITCSDKVALSKYIFSFANGVGSFTNNTAVAFTSTPQTVSVTETLTATVGATIRFRWFFNNTANNWNSTAVQSFTTTLVTVSISPSSATKDVGQSRTFTSSVSGGFPPYSYQWYLNGAAVNGANSTTWTFKPISAGNYSVYLKVTDTIGEVGKSNTAIIVVNPPPTVSVTPTSVSLDIGEPWTFRANVSGGTPPYSYQWYIDDSPVINATGFMWTNSWLVPGNYMISVNVTDSVGIQCGSNTVLVTVSSGMKPTISPLSVLMDVGQSQLYVASVSGGTPPYSYQWYQWLPSGSQPFAGANKTTFDFTPSFAGLNLIYVEITDDLGVKVDIGAEATVNARVSVSVSPSSVTIDAGQSQTLTANVVNGTSPYSYQWYLNGNPVSGVYSSSWTFTPASMGVYEIYTKTTDSLNMSAVSNAATIVANPSPTILVSPPSVALDIGEPWTFRANVSGGTPPYSSFQWYVDGSPVINATGSMWTNSWLVIGSQTIYATATDNLNFECISNEVLVTVNSSMNATISPLLPTIDFGQSQKYTVSVSGGTPPYSYQWYQLFPSGSELFIGATNATFVFTPPGIGLNIIYVVITDSLGIKVDWGATATVNPQPSVTFVPSLVTMDISMSQQFTSVATNGTPPYTYQWYIDGSLVSGATNSNWTYTSALSSVGVHTVYLTVTDSVDFTVYSKNATITVNPPLTASISPTSAATDVGVSAKLTSNVAGGMSPYSYQWYANGSAILGATQTSYTFIPSHAGLYFVSVKVKDSFGFATASKNATVTVNPLPTVALSPTSVSLELGQKQNFTATVTGGTPQYLYKWYVNGSLTAQTTSPTFTFTPPLITKYYELFVLMTDAAGLSATSNTAIINGHDVAVTKVVTVDNIGYGGPKTIFAKGYPIGINVTAADPGYYSETFTVMVYANATVITSYNVTLLSGGIAILALVGTANLPYGHYIVSAYAEPVPGEVNTANNYVANSTRITVTIPGDVNGDGVVNGLDLRVLGANWVGTVPPALGNADVNGDGLINGLDLRILGANWLESVVL